MRKIARALLAATFIAAATLAMGMAQATAGDERVLVATVTQDGKVIKKMPYATAKHEVIVFEDVALCEAFQKQEFFPEIVERLNDYVAQTYPGATVVVSCEPFED